MRIAIVSFVLLAGCSGSTAVPEGACRPSDPACNPGGSSGGDSGTAGTMADAMASATPDAAGGGSTDAARDEAADASCGLWVDDAGVTHGCGKGGNGPGDHDDGGGAPAPPPPDAALDAAGLGLGAPCWNNAQCESNLCFDYNVKGQFCSLRCTTDADCPAPALGCNGMGVCRVGG